MGKLLSTLVEYFWFISLKLLPDTYRLSVFINNFKFFTDKERLEACIANLKLLSYESQLKVCLNGLKFLSNEDRLETCVDCLKLLPDRNWLAIRRKLAVVKELDYSRHKILLNIEEEFEYDVRLVSCRKEPETIKWIETFIKDGDVVYDIGANVGAYALVAAKFTNGRALIYAFEPGFPTFAQLNKNVVLNNCQDNIIPLPLALSSKTNLALFNYHNLRAGGALHSLGAAIDYAGKSFEPVLSQPVLSYRIDDLIDYFDLPVPNHIKLDVDGLEFEILKGAEKTLADVKVRTVMVEINESLEDVSIDIISYLRDKGLYPHAKYEHPENLFNYIFLRTSEFSESHPTSC
ncbi:MAG: FkbM family methyltransferase [Anaerolineae bacterium]|nr:FkbM family methyltransferase [Anaerolineae bacterium]